MRKRTFSITFLVVAFLFSSWGNVIAAAFCPHYSSSRSCHVEKRQAKQVERKSSCHHEMAGMEMDDMQMDDMGMESEKVSETPENSISESSPVQIATDSFSEQFALDLQPEPCGHCWMHSQSPSGIAAVVAIDPMQRLLETNAPPVNSEFAFTSALAISIMPSEHGPPGNSSPRYVLIRVFRI